MRVPRWAVYPALAVLAVFLIPALPRKKPVLEAVDQPASGPTRFKRVCVLGIDGLDPDVLRGVIAKYPDRTPNFARLVGEGGLNVLGTSTPPQSPVAWSNFITGLDPGGHGIFDFIHRDPTTRKPSPSTTKPTTAHAIPLPGSWQFPLGGDSESNRSGKAFWKILAEHGVPAFIFRMPANFPVEPSKGLSFSGMMTPAIDSAYGECTLYTSDPPAENFGQNGKVVTVREFRNESAGLIETSLSGPPNAFKDTGENVRVPIRILVDHAAARAGSAGDAGHAGDIGAAAITVGERTLVLTPGQWSDFVRVSFDLLPMGASVSGTVRFYLRSIEGKFDLYASPVNLDPLDPAVPVSAPKKASADLARAIGVYYTQGMPEDVNALKEHVLTDVEFMQQSDLVHDEGVRMMDWAVDRWLAEKEGGFLFFYFSGIDLCSHMMWRHKDDGHPSHESPFAAQDSSSWSKRPGSTWKDVIDDLYLRMDGVVGRLRARLPADTTLVVMSDHGFKTYRRKFSLNTWLVEKGYLVLKPDHSRELAASDPKSAPVYIYPSAGAVDWTKTRAYGVGFTGLYLNLAGRELDDKSTDANEDGIVHRGAEADALLAEIKGELERLRDGPETVVLRCDLARDVYHGARAAEAPDMLVGYNAGYGNSDESTLGRIPHAVLEDNLGGTFNGNHLMAPEIVPGVLLTNRVARAGAHRLEDLTAEILKQYGIAPEPGMRGTPVLE